MTVASDEAAVRSYLRALVEHPIRATDTTDSTEHRFVRAVARWAKRNSVTEHDLLAIGVPGEVLQAAGMEPTGSRQRVRSGR